MSSYEYIPGHGAASAIMTRRNVGDDAGLFTHHLRPGMDVLDCGCGPGTMTAISFALNSKTSHPSY